MSDKKKGLELLREPFPKNQISALPKPYTKDSPKGHCDVCGGWHGLPAAHLDYVGHAALTDRLLDADPLWLWEPLALKDGLPAFDSSGGLWIKLTVAGHSRIGYGHAPTKTDPGAREKEVIGDALRNAAMRFGAALDLWHKGDLHGEDESKEAPKSKFTPSVPKPNPVIERVYDLDRPTMGMGEDFTLGFGVKYRNTLFSSIKPQDALNYADWVLKNSKEKNKPLSPEEKRFVDAVALKYPPPPKLPNERLPE